MDNKDQDNSFYFKNNVENDILATSDFSTYQNNTNITNFNRFDKVNRYTGRTQGENVFIDNSVSINEKPKIKDNFLYWNLEEREGWEDDYLETENYAKKRREILTDILDTQKVDKESSEIIQESLKLENENTDLTLVKKIIKKVWSTTKSKRSTKPVELNENKTSKKEKEEFKQIEKRIKVTFDQLNEKYKRCIRELKNLIDYLKSNDSKGFEYDEDRLRNENETDIIKIKYEFKNKVDAKGEITPEELDKLMEIYDVRLDQELKKLQTIKTNLTEFLRVKKVPIIENKKDVKRNKKKMSKGKKIFWIIFSILITLIILTGLTLTLLSPLVFNIIF